MDRLPDCLDTRITGQLDERQADWVDRAWLGDISTKRGIPQIGRPLAGYRLFGWRYPI